jgi:hypothetical protein
MARALSLAALLIQASAANMETAPITAAMPIIVMILRFKAQSLHAHVFLCRQATRHS